MQLLANKETREKTAIVLSIVAVLVSIFSVFWGEIRNWHRERGNFQIDVEQEFDGPIALVDKGNMHYLEGYARITIYNHGARVITIDRISAEMLNQDVLTGQLIGRKPAETVLLKVNNVNKIKNIVNIFFIFNQRLNLDKS